MHEIAKVTLDNEMDLILAHKRSMKLGELAGLSLAAQTTFATAVSEVSRTAIGLGESGCLMLCIDPEGREKYVVASVTHSVTSNEKRDDGLAFASRLVDKYNVSKKGEETTIDLFYCMPAQKVDILKLDEWRNVFRNEPPISAYDEIKRKNEQLQDMSEKIKASEERYKTLTNTLPLIIFSMNDAYQITYANEWLTGYTGRTLERINEAGWHSIIHEEDYADFDSFLSDKESLVAANIKLQCRLKHQESGTYLWHLVSLSPLKDDEGNTTSWIGFMADINAQKVFEETLQDNRKLKETQSLLQQNELHLQKNIQELNRSNVELQQFAYVASHDLQEPVRKLMFYSDFLLAKYGALLEGKGITYLNNMVTTARRMRDLIKDLLTFSQVNQKEQRFEQINLNQTLHEALQDLELSIKDKDGKVEAGNLPIVEGDALLLRQLFENLLSNSIKYARQDVPPQIYISYELQGDRTVLYFKDNGIGFEVKYLDKMFALFQRLHNREQYAGTGLGLAICRKIVEVHGGTMTATAKPNEGATFIINLPLKQHK